MPPGYWGSASVHIGAAGRLAAIRRGHGARSSQTGQRALSTGGRAAASRLAERVVERRASTAARSSNGS